MATLVSSVLPYVLWPSLTFAMVALWVVAILDITRQGRKGTFTGAGLASMAALVSFTAIIALASFSAVFAARWIEVVSRAASNGIQASEPEGQGRTYIFSFGLENASYGSPADLTGAKRSQGGAQPGR